MRGNRWIRDGEGGLGDERGKNEGLPLMGKGIGESRERRPKISHWGLKIIFMY